MQDPDQRTYVARVTRPDATGAAGRTTLFYAVLSDTRAQALAAIRQAAQPGDYVGLTEGRLSPETAVALGLIPGVAKPM
jgi:non-ribosomal peptide synthetase component F